jgi:hypothetical protein
MGGTDFRLVAAGGDIEIVFARAVKLNQPQ